MVKAEIEEAMREAAATKVKFSITLDSDIATWVNRRVANRSRFINAVLREAYRAWCVKPAEGGVTAREGALIKLRGLREGARAEHDDTRAAILSEAIEIVERA